MKRCPFCNAEMNDDAVFCPNCGNSVGQYSSHGQYDPQGQYASQGQYNSQGQYGSQDQYGSQGQYGSQAPYPSQAPQPKRGVGKLIIGGVVIAAVAAVGIFAGVKLLGKDPKDVVIDAFKDAFASDEATPAEEVFGWNAIMEKSMKENMEGTFSLALDECSDSTVNMFAGTEIASFSQSDVANKKAYGEFGLKLAGMDLISMEVYADQEKIAAAIPELSEKVFTLDYANDLEGQIQSSPFAGPALEEAGIDASSAAVLKDYMDYIWSFYDTEGERPFDIQALWTRYKEGSQAIDNFKAAMTVEKTDSQEFTVNGETAKCKGYEVVIPQQALIDFVETTSDFFMKDESLKNDVLEYLSQIVAMSGGVSTYGMSAEEMQEEAWTQMEEWTDSLISAMEESMEDISMTVYVDKKGQLAAIEGETTLTVNDVTCDITLDAKFLGGSYPTQNAEVHIELEADDTVTIDIVKEGEYTDAVLSSAADVTMEEGGETLTVSYEAEYDRQTGDYILSLAAGVGVDEGRIDIEGAVSDLVPGESFDIAMDRISVKWAGEEVAVLSGNYSLQPMEGEVTMPEGEEMDVLAATEGDWNEVVVEMNANVQQLLETFRGIIVQTIPYMY